MVKSAGFLKKLKKVGNLIGKGASWVNNNIVKPLNPIIDTALDFVPGGSVIKTAKNFASSAIDNYLPSAPSNRNVQNAVRFGTDVLLDTQRSRQDRKYGYYESDDEYSDEGGYSNPFGSTLN